MPIRGVEAEWPQIRSPKGRWGFRIALLSLSTLFVAGFAFRNRGISLPEFGATLAVGTSLAAIGFLLSVVALMGLWRRGGRGTRLALSGAGLGALGVTPAVTFLVLSALLPPINDVTTNLESPPPLTASSSDRTARGASVEYPAAFAAMQTKSYPEIVALSLPQPPETVFDTARVLIEEYGWRIVAAEKEAGMLVAVAHTLFLNFDDDVAIRITSARQGGARVDMRSASRLGKHDFGTNARRVSSFLFALEDRMNNPQPGR